MPAQVNAKLTRIASAGTAPDWDLAGAAGAQKWAGSADAYYSEKRERSYAAGATDVLLRRTLIVDHDVAEPVDNDDLITFTYDGAEQTAKVRLIERRDLGGLPASVRTTRLTLEDA